MRRMLIYGSGTDMLKRPVRQKARPALCLAVLFGLTVSPLVHEWGTAAQEAAYHHNEPPSTGPAVSAKDPPRPHHHHDSASCGLCLTFARVVKTASLHTPLQHSPTASSLIFVPLTVSSPSRSGSASPRGPPAA